MSPRDQAAKPEQLEVARWVASLGAVTAEALATRLDTTTASARSQLVVAHRNGLLSRDRPLADRPALYTVTRVALRACGARGIRACNVSASNANHLIMCASAAAGLERCYPDHHVVGERELRRDEREHGRSLASARVGVLGYGNARVHRPDLVLWPHGSDRRLPISVEVELTVKAPLRLLEICRGWARCRAVAGVIYLVPSEVERALSRAVAEVRAGERIAIVPLDRLPGMKDVCS